MLVIKVNKCVEAIIYYIIMLKMKFFNGRPNTYIYITCINFIY